MALLKSHNHEDDAIKGIGMCSNRVIAQFFTNDPLVAGNETTDNKPGRSIPSMFARMIFFRTAFESVVSSNNIKIGGNDPIPVYQRMVSLCLDVLYLVYKRDSRLTIERWNFADQTAKLGNNPILKEALETQRNTYLLKINNTQPTFQVDDIYLFYLNGELIGGTSPFTFAFSAPDWKGLGNVLALSQRDEDFREYVYKLYCSYRSNKAMSEFMSYVALCKKSESVNRLRNLDPALVTAEILSNDYSQYDKNGTLLWVSQIPEIKLYAQKPEDFSSDFFINSPLQGGVDALNTPLFLCDGYHQLLYAKKKYWNHDIKVNDKPASDKDDKEARELPGYSEEKHIWLSVNDFLEQDLLKLPYKVDTTKFHAIVAGNESYLLPLRPLFFKYFEVDALKKPVEKGDSGSTLFSTDTDGNKCKVTLRIPVISADGQRKHTLKVEKTYDLKRNVKSWNNRESINFGIFPFYRIPQRNNNFPNITNQYVVMHNINGNSDDFQSSELSFYREGVNQPIGGINSFEANDNVNAKFYHLDRPNYDNSFDYIQIIWKQDENNSICGIVIPVFPSQGNGSNTYTYGIDFGTTNTHIAYKSGTDIRSFGSDEIRMQVGYLNALNADNYDNSCGSGNGEIMLNEKRHFFPHSDESYSFPIRTASLKQNGFDDGSGLFSGACVGFNYSKEYEKDDHYEAELKWKLDNQNSAIIKKQTELFFKEILWMVKNHWLLSTPSDKRIKPKIVITYPQAMTNHGRLLRIWKDAYMAVFECDKTISDQKVEEMVESLAPCILNITRNTLGDGGLLNIDIGGGTTDFQYFREYTAGASSEIDSFYTSALFAGDDLWGKKYQNVEIETNGEETNNFRKQFLTDGNTIRIDGTKYTKDAFSKFKCKEYIMFLFRDENHLFTDFLSEHTDNICRKTMFIHYSAIIYYAAKWWSDNGLQNPVEIQFTGLGSKYIDFLFDDNNKLVKFTKSIIAKVTRQETDINIPPLSDKPKHATAEGASLYDSTSNLSYTKNERIFHTGIAEVTKQVYGNNLAGYKKDLMDAFEKFITAYNGLPSEIDGVIIPKLNNSEVEALKKDGKKSIEAMVQYYTTKAGGDNPKPVNDPMFFWPLKGSLSILI